MGHGVLPQAAFAASRLQKSIDRLTVSRMVAAEKVFVELKSWASEAVIIQPSYLADRSYLSFSDAN